MILGEPLFGVRRYGQLARNLGIPRPTLLVGLRSLVDTGLLERVAHARDPDRCEYRLTEAGRQLFAPALMLMRWGDRYLAGPEGPVHLSDLGKPLDPRTLLRVHPGCTRGYKIEANLFEAVADQLSPALAGVSTAPVPAQNAVAQIGLAGDLWLIRSVGRPQNPPADEIIVREARLESETGHLLGGGEPPPVRLLDFGRWKSPSGDVSHDFRIGVQLDLEREMLIGQRHET